MAKSESLVREGVMTITMTLLGFEARVYFMWVARLAVVVYPMWSCSTTLLVQLYEFLAGFPTNEPVNSLLLFLIK